MQKIKNLWQDKQQRDEIIKYILFGVLTTIINFVCYWLLTRVAGLQGGIYETIANSIAWIISVAVAYITNRKYVFDSKAIGAKAIAKEVTSFFAARVLAYLLFDILTFYLLFNVIGLNDLIAKIITTILVVIFNYVASKIFIFKKQ